MPHTYATPDITSIAEAPNSGTLGTGATVTFDFTFSEDVTVTGKPTLTLNDGGVAKYLSGSGTDNIDFTATVAAGQGSSDLEATAVNLPRRAHIYGAGEQAGKFIAQRLGTSRGQLSARPHPLRLQVPRRKQACTMHQTLTVLLLKLPVSTLLMCPAFQPQTPFQQATKGWYGLATQLVRILPTKHR